MKKVAFLLIACALPYVWPVLTGSEMVWLKDMTSRFRTDRRNVGDSDLPDDLTFYLSRGSHVLSLNLKRNHGINPNADIYIVRTLQDGRTHREKTENLDKEDVGYYQDRDNGAFMTVRCIRRSTGQCIRVIYGNIRIGSINYDLRPAETDVTLRNVLASPGFLGNRYVLQDYDNIQRAFSIENGDAAYVSERNVHKGLVDLIQRFPQGRDNESLFRLRNFTVSSGRPTDLHNREPIGEIGIGKRNKQVYNVEITVVTDSSVWDLYTSLVKMPDSFRKTEIVKRKIRQAFSHFINGAHLLYQGIEDKTIDISLFLREFYIYQVQSDFKHRSSKVYTFDEKKYIEASDYLKDVARWDEDFGSKSKLEYDHVMLFTRHDLYDSHSSSNTVKGISYRKGVCDMGRRVSVVESYGFFSTVSTAAHELGHNLGADHDGEDDAKACNPNDLYIMSPNETSFARGKPHSRNPWMFSTCSVEAFKKILKDKHCLAKIGHFYDEDEFKWFVMKPPGVEYPTDKQCEFIYGPNYVHCVPESADICLYLQCKDPIKNVCLPRHHIAARGTKCGQNMWCMDGLCVPKTAVVGGNFIM